jgi:PAS domain S-box-containing protein
MVVQLKSIRTLWQFILIFLILALGIGVSGYQYYERQKKQIKIDKQNELSAIANLKANQIASWRKERLGDAKIISESNFFIHHLREWLKTEERSELRQEILDWMISFRKNFNYAGIFLFDEKGLDRLSVAEENEPAGFYAQAFVAGVIQTRKIIFTDLFRDKTTNHIHLYILIPLILKERDTLPFGVLLLKILPDQFLYPLIQSWPTPSYTAESMLVRREGDEVVFLNELRHQKNTALSLRLPISKQQLPDAISARGEEGIVEGVIEGVDYRNVPVLAVVRGIPDSPWYLVTKVDQEEIYAPIRENAKFIMTLVGVLIVVAGVSVGFFWWHETARFYRKQYETELERQTLTKRYEFLTQYANDIILLADQNLKIVDANDRAVVSYGYTRDELLEMNVANLRSPEMRTSLNTLFQQLEEQRGIVVETIHQRKDGSTFLVEASIGVIEVEGKKFYQSIVRDITERKKAEDRIRKERDRAQKYLDIAGTIIVVIVSDQTVSLINKKGCEVLGYDEKEITGKNWFNTFLPERVRKEVKAVFNELMSGNIKTVEYVENPVLTKSGQERIVAWHNTVLKDENGRILATLSSGEDITERKRIEKERERLIHELQEALVQVKTLSGLVPICASCKKIRDDKGYWNQIESYIEKHSTAEFTHSICPECARKLYPQLYEDEK